MWLYSYVKIQDFDSGVKTRGAGEGKPFVQGEIGKGEPSRQEELRSFYFSGDSTSLSPIWMSVLILWARGRRFKGERVPGESGRGRFFALLVFTGGAETACRRWTQAWAAWRREPIFRGGREWAAKAAQWRTERRKLLRCFEETFFWEGSPVLESAPEPWGKYPLGKRGCMGRWRADTGGTWDGGGITSEALGSWNVRFSTARPPGSASSR